MRFAVIAALVIAVGLTIGLLGRGTGPLSEDEVHTALVRAAHPVRFLDTDYDGPGAVVAAAVRQEHRHAKVLVASEVGLNVAQESVDWKPGLGVDIGIGGAGEGGDNDLYVWVSDDLTAGAVWDIIASLCKARLDNDEQCDET